MKPVFALLVVLAVACNKPAPEARQTTTGDAGSSSNAPTRRLTNSPTRHKIIFAGTSLTAGLGLDPDSAYPHLVQLKLDSAGLDAEVVNAGVSGETTAGLLQRLDWLLRGDFDVFVVESGANDGLRGVPADAIEANLRKIIERVRAARPAARIALIQMEALPNYGRTYGTAFHDLYVRVARDEKVTLLPFLLDRVAGRADLNQADGLHPNLEGEHIVADNVWRGVLPLLKAPH
jgi:acyl-CoA thioesterase I